MAKPTISLLGATYSDVSGVKLPVSGGGTASFPFVEGSQTVTNNGTYNVTALAEMVVNVAPTTPYAAIGVLYTVGGICTCSNGSITMQAEDTSGKYIFSIPANGSWTVVCGNQTKTVVISAQYQFESINLAGVVEVSRDVLTLALFRGSSYMTYVNNQGSASITEEGDDYFRLYTGSTSSYREWVRKVGVDVTNFSKMKVVGYKDGGNTFVGLSTSSTSVANTDGVITISSSTEAEMTVDISSLTGTRYIYFRGLMSYIYIKSIEFLY